MSQSKIDPFGHGNGYSDLFDGLTLLDNPPTDPVVTAPDGGVTIQPEPALAADSPATTASHVSAGLHINLIPDASVANAPATFASEIRQAADIIEAAFSDPITLNIRYGWGTYNNRTATELIGGNFAEGGDNFQT